MLSNDLNATPLQSSEVPVMNPDDPIEVTPGGNGTVNDPAASDTKPPYTPGDLDGFLG